MPGAVSEVMVDADRVVVRLGHEQDADEASVCVLAVFEALRSSSTGEAIVDLRDFSSMSRDAQSVWQAALSDLTGALRGVTVIGGTPLARTAIMALCLRAGIPVRQAASV